MGSAVTVDEVTGGKALARFVELPQALHGEDPRFAPLVMGWERYRLDRRRNPALESVEVAFLLARRLGRPVGRIAVYDDGRFGSWWVDDDHDVASALVGAAREWLVEQGCTAMVGEAVQVAGFETPGVTGRPWHPPHLARLLEDLDFESVEDVPSWRLPVSAAGPELPLSDDVPGEAGSYTDPRLVLDGIAAVPDLSDALRTAGLRSAWSLAKRARAREWATAVVVRCTADPAVAVPALQLAAGRAGYREVVAPWSPNPTAAPETLHRTYRHTW
jgi:GNAT superfamily N-acetyltransferase